MARLPKCDTNAELLELIRATGRPFEVLARTIYSMEIVCVRTGGNKEPAIVVTAGSHAGEPAGVLAALELISRLETEHAVYIVPLRDPFAWAGFGRCLSLALDQPVTVNTHPEAEQLLAEHGTVIYQHPENALVVAHVADMVFASMRPLADTSGPRDIERRLNREMAQHPELVPKLAGKRACWPSNLTGVEGCGDFDRAFSVSITSHGLVADLNRQFSYAFPPVEVACVRDLVDRIKPGLVLDLHESQESKFFIFIGTATGEAGRRRDEVASAIVGAVAAQGGALYSLEELSRRIPRDLAQGWSEPQPGLFAGNVHNVRQGGTFNNYCQRYGIALGVETGRWKPLAERVDQQVVGALAGIRAFEQLSPAH